MRRRRKQKKTMNFVVILLVIILAILISVIPVIILNLDPKTWIMKSLIFLVASCPCSIVIAIPLGLFSAVGALSKKGIIVKGTKYIEPLSKPEAIAFDKTGTITTGEKIIDEVEVLGDMKEKNFKDIIYNMERLSNHPIAKAIEKYVENPEILEIEKYEDKPGYGVYAMLEGKETLLGNKKLLELYNIDIERKGEDLTITVCGNGFLYNMVRIMVGTLLEIGRGERDLRIGEDVCGCDSSCRYRYDRGCDQGI